jgi:hypothetical protein
MINARNTVEKGGLSRPVGADNSQDLFGFYLEINVRKGLDATKTDGQCTDVKK